VRFTLEHPLLDGWVAIYGFHFDLRYFAEVTENGVPVESYDALHPGVTSIEGVLCVLVRHGFVDPVALAEAEARRLLPDAEHPEPPDDTIKRATEVLSNLHRATSDSGAA
jgi:hypothetical protein